MKIIISNLAEGEHLYNFVQSAEELGFEDYTFKDKIKINIKLFKGNRQIILGVSFNCSVVKCLTLCAIFKASAAPVKP